MNAAATRHVALVVAERKGLGVLSPSLVSRASVTPWGRTMFCLVCDSQGVSVTLCHWKSKKSLEGPFQRDEVWSEGHGWSVFGDEG